MRNETEASKREGDEPSDTSLVALDPRLPALLSEANIRSQFFMDKLWQIPLAYAAISTFILASPTRSNVLSSSFVCLIGAFVIWHMISMLNGNRRATRNLIALERRMNITEFDQTTAQILGWHYIAPSFFVPIAVIAAAIVIAFL